MQYPSYQLQPSSVTGSGSLDCCVSYGEVTIGCISNRVGGQYGTSVGCGHGLVNIAGEPVVAHLVEEIVG